MYVQFRNTMGNANDDGSLWSFVRKSSASDLSHNIFAGDLSDAQRQAIAVDCATSRQMASAGKLTLEQAIAECTTDVNIAAPPKFNWKPYAVVAGIAGVGLYATKTGRR